MEQEKIKQIKIALECNATDKYNVLPYIDKNDKCKTIPFADILTHINELEKGNREKAQNLAVKSIISLSKSTEQVSNEKVKQFAEFIKNKLFDLGNVVTVDDIDEILKEFI